MKFCDNLFKTNRRCSHSKYDAADLLFDKLVLLHRTSLCSVILTVKSIRTEDKNVVSKHKKCDMTRVTDKY